MPPSPLYISYVTKGMDPRPQQSTGRAVAVAKLQHQVRPRAPASQASATAAKAASAHPKVDVGAVIAQGEKRLRRQAVMDIILTAKPAKRAPTKSVKPPQLPTLPKYYTHPQFMGIREQREAIAAFKRYLRAADAMAVIAPLSKDQAYDVECAHARLAELYQHSGLAAF